MPTLVWKDEGEEGPATLFYDDSLRGKLWPIGMTPDTVEKLGWMTRKQAQQRANALDVKFEEV